MYLLDEVSISGSDVFYGFSYWTCAEGSGFEVGPACPAGTRPEETFTISSSDPHPRQQGQRRGVIRQAMLPTGGVIDFNFDVWSFEHHTTDGTPIIEPPECDIDFGGPAAALRAEFCAPSYAYQLGVTKREVTDANGILARTVYDHSSNASLILPVRFDAGNPTVWNPKPGYRDAAYDNDLREYRTSYATTVVTNDFIVDENGGSTEIGTNPRSDDSVYYFSLGTTVIDHRITDGWIQVGEGFTLPLTGALIFEQHYRGDRGLGDVERTIVHTYTVDDDGGGWSIDGPRYGSHLNRRPRELITYFHGAAPGGADLVSVSRYGFENDLCSASGDEPCPNVAPGVSFAEAFASHRTDIGEQIGFTIWSRGFSRETMFDPLATAVFDRTTRRTYWKDAISSGDWLLNRFENELSNVDGAAESEFGLEYGANRGELLEQRLYADPGAGTTSDDVVTSYVYVNDTSDSGHGQIQRRRVGLAGGAIPDVSEFVDYSHGVASRTWTLCEGENQDVGAGGPPAAAGRCDGWSMPSAPPALAAIGLKAELQGEKTIDDG